MIKIMADNREKECYIEIDSDSEMQTFSEALSVFNSMVQEIAQVDSLKLFTFVPFQELLIPMIATFAFAGLFVGVVGSWTSIRKFMNV